MNTMVVATVGDTLRIVNDDTVTHRLHTSGSPFLHPTDDIQPGQAADDLLQQPFDPRPAAPLYDHSTGRTAEFWILVNAAR